MENYQRRPKATKSKFENDDDSAAVSGATAGSKTNPQPHNRPQQYEKHGVMVISPHGKIRTYVTRALEILTEVDVPETKDDANTSRSSTSGAKDSGDIKAKSILSVKAESATSTSKPESTPSSASSISNTTSSPCKSSTRGVLTIKAQGRSITKAVTVAEILKRRMEGSLHQFTEIGQITEKEIWDPNPDKPNLDPLTVSRHRPTIRIRLSKHLDAQAASGSGATVVAGSGLTGIDPSLPGALIPRDEYADEEEDADDDSEGESWPGAILDRDAAARRFVGYQAPTGNDIYL
ncbi:hypothetical protein BGZ99_004118 [Dissophora globulifera]|uniref:DNA/RNA-binding protein Alba-like domain-containing protein n=1 Tax=Dissophora globulifera TaxID=979702 RepID=A0A9P6RIT9_9FUNG|nr:hypothetical protein BGZ99_004118 [Dissophora globulifera]